MKIVDDRSASLPVPKPIGVVVSREQSDGPCGWIYILECGHQYSEKFDGVKEVGQTVKCHVCTWWEEDDKAGRRRYGTSRKGDRG